MICQQKPLAGGPVGGGNAPCASFFVNTLVCTMLYTAFASTLFGLSGTSGPRWFVMTYGW